MNREWYLEVTTSKGNDLPALGFDAREDALRAAKEFRAQGCFVKVRSIQVEPGDKEVSDGLR